MKVIYIPKELLDIILEYDGRIKYKNGKYVNIIHKYDLRYYMLAPVIDKKTIIMKSVHFTWNGFYFEFNFDKFVQMGLSYDYNFFREKPVEICYYDFRHTWIQIRTYLL
jgi:hypothetical protein